jgi:hypothetical protein
MMSPAELRRLCRELRAGDRTTDDVLVKQIVSDVVEYRTHLRDPRPQLPPKPLDDLLWLMGWLIYEASWASVQKVVASFDRPHAPQRDRDTSTAQLRRISKLADAARGLPWPEFAPRALGAVRAYALAQSKRDSAAGYDAAWTAHQEARTRYRSYRDSHGASRERYVLALDEMLLQLALAETGTACRTAERVVSRWAPDFASPGDPDMSRPFQEQWVQRMFRELSGAVELGEEALDTGTRIAARYGFAYEGVTEDRLTRPTLLQNPGIMTARAAGLLLALGPVMQDLGRQPAPYRSWADWEAATLRRFVRAYRAVDDGEVPLSAAFQRQLVHIRLNLALLRPGFELPSHRSFAPCLAHDPLDDAALEALSDWLAGPAKRGRERLFGAATMPLLIRSLSSLRASYPQWRRRWFCLDQYADEPGRREIVESALTAAAR